MEDVRAMQLADRKRLHIPAAAVGHPSYGGQGAFIAGLYKFYGIEDDAAIDDGAVLPFGEDA